MPLSSLQKQDFGLILSFWGLSAVLVPMRVLARMSSRFSFGMDDYLLWVAFVFNTIEMAICVAVTCLGQGKSQTEVSQKNIVIVLKVGGINRLHCGARRRIRARGVSSVLLSN